MSSTTLLAAAGVNLVVAASFFLVGRAVSRQDAGKTHGALLALAIWWWALAAYLAIQAALFVDVVVRGPSLAPYLASRVLVNPMLCVAAGSLTYYMLYLFTGRHQFRLPVALLYTATLVLFVVATFTRMPTGLSVTDWMIRADTADGLLERIVYFLVGIPPIASSIALLVVAHRLDPPQRYRAVLVGIAILAYVGSGLAAFQGDNATVQFAALTGMGILASACVLLAYYPPAALRRRYGLGETQGMVANERRDKHTHDVQARCAELV